MCKYVVYIKKPVRKIEDWSSGDLKKERGRPKMIKRKWVINDMNDLDVQIEIIENGMNEEEEIHMDDH